MKRWVSMAVVIPCCLFVLASCGPDQSAKQQIHPTTTTTAPPLPGGYGLVTPDPSLTTQIVLSSTRIASGHSINGTLLVVNRGTIPINLTKACRPDFVVALTNSNYVPQVAFATVCSGRPFTIAPGANHLHVDVTTTYLGCRQGGSPSTVPNCLSDEPPPLPAGNYDAVLIGDGLALPEPRPVPVTLTATGR